MLSKLAEYFSRKFVLSLAALFGSFGLVWFGKDVEDLLGIIGLVVGGYNGSNVAQKWVDYKRDKARVGHRGEETADDLLSPEKEEDL